MGRAARVWGVPVLGRLPLGRPGLPLGRLGLPHGVYGMYVCMYSRGLCIIYSSPTENSSGRNHAGCAWIYLHTVAPLVLQQRRWESGLIRQLKALIPKGAWVRTPHVAICNFFWFFFGTQGGDGGLRGRGKGCVLLRYVHICPLGIKLFEFHILRIYCTHTHAHLVKSTYTSTCLAPLLAAEWRKKHCRGTGPH